MFLDEKSNRYELGIEKTKVIILRIDKDGKRKKVSGTPVFTHLVTAEKYFLDYGFGKGWTYQVVERTQGKGGGHANRSKFA